MCRFAIFACVLFCALSAGLAQTEAAAVANGHAQLQCSGCHVPINGSRTANFGASSEFGGGSQQMSESSQATFICRSCHDGVVAPATEAPSDSLIGRAHPVDVSYLDSKLPLATPELVGVTWRIPRSNFKLYANGSGSGQLIVRCTTCHAGHAVSPHNLRTAYDGKSIEFCSSCHI